MSQTPSDEADQFIAEDPAFVQLRKDVRRLARRVHNAELVQFASVAVAFLAAFSAAAVNLGNGWALAALILLAPVGWALGRANNARNAYEIKMFEAHMLALTKRAGRSDGTQEQP